MGEQEHRRLVRTLWDKDSDYYEACRKYVLEAAKADGEYAWLKRQLPERGLVLEVGCGEGINIEVLSRPGLRFVGCDVAGLPLRMAQGRVPADGSRAFLQADAERLPFPPATFDAVFAISVLEHLVTPERAVSSMAEVLRPGGSLLLVSPNYGGPLGASPGRRGGGASRFLRRMLGTLSRGRPGDRLGWERIDPPVLDGVPWEGDFDALVEPELRSLRGWMRGKGLEIVDSRSGLGWYSWTSYPGGGLVRGLRHACEGVGRLGVPVFRDFGPLIAIHARRAV